ncbi:MAG: Hsp20/alpha crystallin family protein [Rubrivivax sp.]|nr:MAG: Hsp20/alpha crystallin family protein [Rubrivivax sp.]
MYTSMLSFPASVFSDFDRLRRDLDDVFGLASAPSGIRSVAPGTYPAINVGHTPTSVEIYAFAPGVDAAQVDVSLDRGVLTISGERPSTTPEARDGQEADKVSVYSRERVSGRFKRAVSLPDDVDPDRVQATYRDGVLHISVARREAAQPRRIAIQ